MICIGVPIKVEGECISENKLFWVLALQTGA